MNRYEDKSNIRISYLDKLHAHTPNPIEDQKIHENLITFLLDCPKNTYIFSYYNRAKEFNSSAVLNEIKNLRPDLNIFIPRIMSLKRAGARMDFYELDFKVNPNTGDFIINQDSLIENSFGIIEPRPNGSKLFSPEFIDLSKLNIVVIMPGLVFDKYGNRIGFAGGYYDRYLARLNGNGTYVVPLRELHKYNEELPYTFNDMKVHVHVDRDGIKDLR